jgi:hypothetical protein
MKKSKTVWVELFLDKGGEFTAVGEPVGFRSQKAALTHVNALAPLIVNLRAAICWGGYVRIEAGNDNGRLWQQPVL